MRWLIGFAGVAAATLAFGACASITGLSAFSDKCTDNCGDATTSSSSGGHVDGSSIDSTMGDDSTGLDAPVGDDGATRTPARAP